MKLIERSGRTRPQTNSKPAGLKGGYFLNNLGQAQPEREWTCGHVDKWTHRQHRVNLGQRRIRSAGIAARHRHPEEATPVLRSQQHGNPQKRCARH